MAQQCPAKIDAPFHMQRRMRLDLLRKQLREHDLLGEILRADDNRFPAPRVASGGGQREQGHEKQKKAGWPSDQ